MRPPSIVAAKGSVRQARAVAGADRVDVGVEDHAGRALAQSRDEVGDRRAPHRHGDFIAGCLEMLGPGFADRPGVARRRGGGYRDQFGEEAVKRLGERALLARHDCSSASARMIDVALSERGSRASQWPFST